MSSTEKADEQCKKKILNKIYKAVVHPVQG